MSPAPSSDRDAMFATSAEFDDGALAELREFTAAFERRLADAPPSESVPPAASRAAAYQGVVAEPRQRDWEFDERGLMRRREAEHQRLRDRRKRTPDRDLNRARSRVGASTEAATRPCAAPSLRTRIAPKAGR